MDTLKILERIKTVTNSKNYAELARKLNIKDSTIRTWKTRGTVPYEACVLVTLNYDTTLEWLLTGEAPSSVAKNRVNETQVFYNNITLPFYELKTESEHEYTDIEESDISNLLIKSNKQARLITFNLSYLKQTLDVDPKRIYLMEALGDSMSPTINDGTVIMVNKVIQPFKDAIYVIQQGDAILIKRLQFLVNEQIKVISDNAKYDTYTVDKSVFDTENIHILGKVVWVGQKV